MCQVHWVDAVQMAALLFTFGFSPAMAAVTVKQDVTRANHPYPAMAIGSTGQIPAGFQNLGEFQQFANSLYSGLRAAGYEGVTAIFQGSSVTGVKYTTGQPFDVGRVSDYDVALASPNLLARANELGIGLRPDGTRTGPLTGADLDQLGLSGMQAELSQAVGRPVNFMIFQSADAALSRSLSIVVPDYQTEPLAIEPSEPVDPIEPIP